MDYKKYLTKNNIICVIAGIFVIALIIIIPNWLRKDINIVNDSQEGLLSQFIETKLCERNISRPMAVMLSSDPEARPLSGIGQADIVFEMPVTEGGVTRIMAVYQCTRPEEIGSIRSARLDFIPLVQGLDAIYSHWGGEAQALAQLNKGATDNVNGLFYDGTVYYRKNGIPAPHDGFSSYSSLFNKALELGYSASADIERSYTFVRGKSMGGLQPPIVYAGNFDVTWIYDSVTNTYNRSRNGSKEMDANTKTQVAVENVVYMRTTWTPIDVNYIRVTTIGSGPATIYKNGIAIKGMWNKPTAQSKLVFLDENGKEISFTKGKIWIEIINDI